MRILHLSDTHGFLPAPIDTDFDVVVHSGDLMPNRTFGLRVIEEPFQRAWIEHNAPKFSPHYWTKPFLFTPGNHDFIDPTPVLRDLGIDARYLCDSGEEIDGVRFYGHPWTPTFYDWAWMCGPNEMRGRLALAAEYIETSKVDVLVSHGPMFGVLDRNQDGERCGCKDLRKTTQRLTHVPRAMLHGHIHEAAGLLGWSRGMIVSNAARTQRVVEI